jgi:hypothetical protein
VSSNIFQDAAKERDIIDFESEYQILLNNE